MNELKEKTMKIITVDNGNPNYPGSFAKKEIEIIESLIEGNVLHLFSGKSSIGHVRVDFSQPEATINTDVFEYLKTADHFDTVILDPPYNEKFGKKYDKLNTKNGEQFVIFADTKRTKELFDGILRIAPNTIIMKSWNYYVPQGYYDAGSYLCYAGGYRKPTILMVCKKLDKSMEEIING